MKKHTKADLGIDLQDITSVLEKVHGKMPDLRDATGKEIETDSPYYIGKGDRLVVKVFQENFYTENMETYKQYNMKSTPLVIVYK